MFLNWWRVLEVWYRKLGLYFCLDSQRPQLLNTMDCCFISVIGVDRTFYVVPPIQNPKWVCLGLSYWTVFKRSLTGSLTEVNPNKVSSLCRITDCTLCCLSMTSDKQKEYTVFITSCTANITLNMKYFLPNKARRSFLYLSLLVCGKWIA